MKKLLRIEFKNIFEVDETIQSFVRKLRNKENVRKYMYTDHLISEKEHLNWLYSLRNNVKNRIFVIFFDDNPIGVVSLNNINLHHLTADWAFYISGDYRGQGVGSIIEYKLINYAFDEIGLEKLNCEVLEINPSVIRLHEKFGFIEEGIKRKCIVKDGKRIDVILLGILKEEWLTARVKIERSFKKYE